MKLQKLTSLLFIILTFVFFNCQDDTMPKVEKGVNTTTKKKMENVVKLGEKLKNPYSVKNMQIALDTIYEQIKLSKNKNSKLFRRGVEKIKIKSTDLYVRFLPKDSLELDLIKKDTTLNFYEYPLDYEIKKQGDVYHDPKIAKDQITWQYTVVKPNYKFPKVKHEILSELFIPRNSEGYSEEETKGQRRNEHGFSKTFSLDKLETVSLYLTNNLSKEETEQIEHNKKYLSRRVCILWGLICWNEPDPWYPSGTIRIQDTELGWQPIQGVKVRARRWFWTSTGYTDVNGNFRLGSFKRPVRYQIVWETYQFGIRQKWWWFFAKQAVHNGPYRKGSWNANLTSNSLGWFHGTIFQAAYHYYYQDINGLKRPYLNSFWKPRMTIRAHFEDNDDKHGVHSPVSIAGIFARIRIYNPNRTSPQIYATTIHELAHASHSELISFVWNKPETKVSESWARGVQWSLTRMKYAGYRPPYFGDYTGVVEDMIDGISGYDQVENYTIKEIEDALRGTKTWNEWRDKIKNKYNNDTEDNLDALFNFW